MIVLQNLILIMESSSNKKDAKYYWELWETKIDENKIGIRWENDHHLWTDWSEWYIESIMREPDRNIPWKWNYCKAPIISNYSLIQFILKAVLSFIVLVLTLMRADTHLYFNIN